MDLFSGIGGFALAASWVWGDDHEIVTFCEKEEFPRKVLKKHWPNVPCNEDIFTLKGDNYGTIDLITGGFPCQPFSVAGKQRGTEDDRYLWSEVFRIFVESKPRAILLENVTGLCNMAQLESLPDLGSENCTGVQEGNVRSIEGPGILQAILAQIEQAGYTVQPIIIPACAVNASHRRDRVWIVAYREGKHDRQTYTEQNQRSIQQPGKCTLPDVFTDSGKFAMPQKNTEDGTHGEKRGAWGRIEREIGRMLPRINRFLYRPRILGIHDGLPGRLDRGRGLGNAIVPQAAAIIMIAMKEIMEESA
jgi:DNA (cytosine-5)-methyltransferase 1